MTPDLNGLTAGDLLVWLMAVSFTIVFGVLVWLLKRFAEEIDARFRQGDKRMDELEGCQHRMKVSLTALKTEHDIISREHCRAGDNCAHTHKREED